MSLTTLARRLGAWCLPLALAAGAAPAQAADDFLDVQQAFRGAARVVDARTLELRFDIAPGYHLYRERIAVERERGQAQLGALALPRAEREFDASLGKEVETYRGSMVAQLPVQAGDGSVRLRVNHQGCADAGLCYPPQTSIAELRVEGGAITAVKWQADADAAGPTSDASATTPAAVAAPEPGDTGRVEAALHSGSLLTIAGVFLLAGVLLSFTPCVLPMVPILSSIIVGQGASRSRRRGFSLALA